MSLIIKLIEYFILRNPVESVKSIIFFDIFAFFVNFVTVPKYKNVRHLLTCLIDPSDKYLGLPQEIKTLLWKYCKNSCHILDLISLMVNPAKGLLTPDEGYLGKGIETKILIEEVEQTALTEENNNQLGLRMFNYKLIDLECEAVLEEQVPNIGDIDQISEIIGFKMLVSKKNLPPTSFELRNKEMIVKKQISVPLAKLRQQKSMKLGTFNEINSKSKSQTEEEAYEQKQLAQLLNELAIRPEDEAKIKRFIDYHFNELIYKELMAYGEPKKAKRQTATEDRKSTYLHDYMKFLRGQASIIYNSYGIKPNQLDGNILGKQEMHLYPCKIKTTNHIDVRKIEEFIGTMGKVEILEYEDSTREIASLIYQIIRGASIIDSALSGNVKKTVTYEFWDGFFHGTLIDNFEKIYLCYLIKMEYFMDSNYVNSSVFYFGEIVNHLLEHASYQGDLYRFKASFTRVMEVNIGLFKSIFLRIFEHFKQKANNPRLMKFQDYTIVDPLGIPRLQIAETFIYFCSLIDPLASRFDEDELTTIIQIMLTWLIEKKYHSIYVNRMVRLLNILVEPKHVRTLVNVLIKLNTVSILHQLYFRIELNEVFQAQLLADQLHMFIKVFVNKIAELLKTTKDKDLPPTIKSMITWQELHEDIKNKRNTVRPTVKQAPLKNESKFRGSKFLSKGITTHFVVRPDREREQQDLSSKRFESSDDDDFGYGGAPQTHNIAPKTSNSQFRLTRMKNVT